MKEDGRVEERKGKEGIGYKRGWERRGKERV